VAVVVSAHPTISWMPTAEDYMIRKLNVLEAAALLGVSKSWLDKKRLAGGGPQFHKFGRRVLYDTDDLDVWAADNKHRHTSDALPPMKKHSGALS
jgi:hypothetical protein